MKKIVLVGDLHGIPELLERIPRSRIAAVVVAGIRGHEHEQLLKLADLSGLPLIVQPRKTSAEYANFQSSISRLRPDGLICHSYSMLIQKEILDLVEGRAFNVHMALLPRNRGPNPVQWALIHGESQTGVTLHLMDETFDAGPLIAQESTEIGITDTWVTLSLKLKALTKQLLDRALPDILSGNWTAVRQNEAEATSNSRISKDSFAIDFAVMDDLQIYNLIRAQVAPLAGAYLQTAAGRQHFSELISIEQIAQMRCRDE
ncbi:methionyl-tRNA formyltransferase [Polaromonas aquatica]|uniref:methionyl-tRNA formyltransferase n=1 Tax=Polaromonas aquatica TaxID=332657 RepID=UPI003D6602AA